MAFKLASRSNMSNKQPCGREGGFRESYALGEKPRVIMKACFKEIKRRKGKVILEKQASLGLLHGCSP